MKPLYALLALPGLVLAMATPPQGKPAASMEKPPGSPGVMLKDDDLRAAPEATAPVLARLRKNGGVRVLASQGGWTRVSAAGNSGWVRILSVRSSAPSSAAADLAALADAEPRDAGKVVAVAGVRGLTGEALSLARFDAAELRRLDNYALDAATALQFARAAALLPRELAYLPFPNHDSAPGAVSPWKGIEP